LAGGADVSLRNCKLPGTGFRHVVKVLIIEKVIERSLDKGNIIKGGTYG
jgi:hypothetical protein